MFLTDAEIAKRLGLGAGAFRIASQQPGFPRKMKAWAGKRWFPAVLAFIENQNRTSIVPSAAPVQGAEIEINPEAFR